MSFRTQVLRGGTYLALRQGLGVIINFGGVILLTRAIGPKDYGLYAAALGIFEYLQPLTQWGINVYLVRQEEEREELYHQSFTLLLLLSVGGILLTTWGLPLLEAWMRLPGFSPAALSFFLSLPLVQLSQVALVRLERVLDYKQVALFELLSIAAYYIAALPIAFRGGGVVAPLVGWWIQQILTLVFVYRAARYSPRLYWDKAIVKQMLSYGFGYSASVWVWQLRSLVSPLLVGRYLGAEAVGYIALAIRFVRGLSFVQAAAWRISLVIMARVQQDKARLVRAVTEGAKFQLLGQGPLLVAFGWSLPWLLPLLFGSSWLPVIIIYPFIALSYLTNVVFNFHSNALYVLERNWAVTVFHLVHVALFIGTASLLVPRLGLEGYGWAEVIALVSYSVIHVYLVRYAGSPDYRRAGVWWIALALALFTYSLGWWVSLGLLGVALWPETWREIGGYIKSLRDSKNEK
jgi:PST family polysaccharide transporter